MADKHTIQKWISKTPLDRTLHGGSSAQDLFGSFTWSVGSKISKAPRWWSRKRDEWMNDFWKLPGNDILAGAMATMVAKVASTGWYISGPMSIAMAVRDMLANESQFRAGYTDMIQPWVEGYYGRDMGGIVECHRASATDHEGPALGYAHLDESKCLLTRNPEYPIMYEDGESLRPVHRSQLLRIVDMPSGRERDRGVGFCSVGRCIVTAQILMDLAKYKRERLSDLPPAGLMFISNLTWQQWQQISRRYNTRQRNENNEIWRDLMVICGVDPQYPTSAEMFELSQLPEHFDERDAVELAVYTFSIAFRTDAREFWPVSSGPLGTGMETRIQHLKAKGKGVGIVLSAIERAFAMPHALPEGTTFRFDYRDNEDDMEAATIDHQRLQNIRLMWESSPNRNMPEGQTNDGIITTEEARALIQYWDIMPPGIVSSPGIDKAQVYDVRAFGPPVRAYDDGRIVPIGVADARSNFFSFPDSWRIR